MIFLKEKNAKYIFLIGFISIHLIGYSTAALSCVQCSVNGTKCNEHVSGKPGECADDTFKKCYTQIDTSGNIERGCRKPDEETTCTTEKNCVLSDEGKNNQLICKKCDGSDEKCAQTDMIANDLKYNQICDAGITKCIVKVDNKLTIRSCASDSDVSKCTDANTCKTCDSINCNTGIFPEKRIKCYQCSGSTCADVTANSVSSKPCLNYEEKDECFTKAESEVDMSRGCKSDSKDNKCSTNAEGCAFCTANNCNSFKYKRDQGLKCHQCKGDSTSTECFKEQAGTADKNCEKQILYNATEYCYTKSDGDDITRGCLHDALTLDECKDGDSYCSKCNSSDGCNNKAVSNEFTCIVCRSDLDKMCYDEAQTLTGKKCRTSESSSKDGCFHGIWNGVAIRGCVVDASIQNQEICKDTKSKQCNICYKKNCNTEKTSGAGKAGITVALMFVVLSTLWNLK